MSAFARLRVFFTVIAMCLLITSSAFAQWQNAQRLNESYEAAVKAGRVCASKDGGFHAIYARSEPWQLCYRRYHNGYLTPRVVIRENFCPLTYICEAGNGDIHLVWEDWLYRTGWDGDTPEVGWSVSKDGGATFSPWQEISTTRDTKHPHIVPFGGDNSSNVIMSYWLANGDSPGGKNLFYREYNGTSWDTLKDMGQNADNEYEVFGMCRSLKDGTVYRAYGTKIGGTSDSDLTLCYRRFNGSYWEPQVVVAKLGFFARQSIAVNPVGQVMVLWERNSKLESRLYTPGVGWGPITIVDYNAGYAGLTAIPGTNDFYCVYAEDVTRIWGKRWTGSTWSAREKVSQGMPDQFSLDTDCSAGPDGTIYASWEAWGTGNCQQYFSIRPATVQSKGTLTGFVRDQYGQGIEGVSVGSAPYVAVSDANGAYSLSIPAGIYNISASKDYYTGQTVTGVQIYTNQTTVQDFTVTTTPPAPVQSFIVNASNGINRLYWTNPSSGNFHATMIRYKTTGFPTSPSDGALLVDMRAAPGSSVEYSHSGLTNGTTYYYSAFAHDISNHFASGVQRSGTPLAPSCAYARTAAEGAIVDLRDKRVTAVFSDENCIYIADPDKSAGIRVFALPSGITVGDRVNVSGTVQTYKPNGTVAAERMLANPTVTRISSATPLDPLAMQCKAVGGGPLEDICVGVNGGVGLNNIGSLAKITGKVTLVISTYIYVDDGSEVEDINGRKGVMVKCATTPDSTWDDKGTVVSVTGIIQGSIPTGWTESRRFIKCRSSSDIQVIK